ncbi:MAG: alpha/beta fold hydrolase, partial [Synechococcales bacterium]|nr:alpha/beta fold hydrolase [Synechococcales bacterium]
TLYRFTYAPMVEALLTRLGQAFQTSDGENGAAALRNAMILSASSEGFSILNILRRFPGDEVRVSLPALLQFAVALTVQTDYQEAVLGAIAQFPDANPVAPDLLAALPDFSQPGGYEVETLSVVVPVRAVRATEVGFVSAYDFDVDLYLPQGRAAAPVVLMTHGFGATRDNYAYFAEHLASHGFTVVAPEHIGSNLAYRQEFLEGNLEDLLSPMEYVSRSLDLIYTLDYLEAQAEAGTDWAMQLDLERVGVFGNSLGGTTALSVAGAAIDEDRLQQECLTDNNSLDLAVILQCPAKHLPPVDYDLTDPRIDVAIAAYPLTSILFGPEGMGNIQIPTLMFSGSNDVIAPAVQEQIHPFVWMTTGDRYLAIIERGTHFSTSDERYIENFPNFLKAPDTAVGQRYLEALSVAFLRRYLEEDIAAQPYLTAAYAGSISDERMPLRLTGALTAAQMEAAYGGPPPVPVVPASEESRIAENYPSVLEAIASTGTLTVGIRADAAPFGYLDGDGVWTGYCFELVAALGDRLTDDLNLENPIQVVRLPSTLENRYDLVQSGTVQLECGPNTIRQDVPEVTFSYPFFYTGTQFLMLEDTATSVGTAGGLSATTIGVLANTTNAQFVQSQYPQSNIVVFEGATGRSDAVQALKQGTITTFASDSALLLGELLRLNLPREDYALFPGDPLTCDAYGLVLPVGDRQWQQTVNTFLRSPENSDLQRVWFADVLPDAIASLDHCLSVADPF